MDQFVSTIAEHGLSVQSFSDGILHLNHDLTRDRDLGDTDKTMVIVELVNVFLETIPDGLFPGMTRISIES